MMPFRRASSKPTSPDPPPSKNKPPSTTKSSSLFSLGGSLGGGFVPGTPLSSGPIGLAGPSRSQRPSTASTASSSSRPRAQSPSLSPSISQSSHNPSTSGPSLRNIFSSRAKGSSASRSTSPHSEDDASSIHSAASERVPRHQLASTFPSSISSSSAGVSPDLPPPTLTALHASVSTTSNNSDMSITSTPSDNGSSLHYSRDPSPSRSVAPAAATQFVKPPPGPSNLREIAPSAVKQEYSFGRSTASTVQGDHRETAAVLGTLNDKQRSLSGGVSPTFLPSDAPTDPIPPLPTTSDPSTIRKQSDSVSPLSSMHQGYFAAERRPSEAGAASPYRKLSQTSNTSLGSTGTGDSSPSADSKASRDQRAANKDVWDLFIQFVTNSRHSDSLVYAATRKEAWLQFASSSVPVGNDQIVELWLMMALRFVIQNQLLCAPTSIELVTSSPGRTVLDVQGVFRDHWAWQLALDYPDAMIYGLKLDPSKTSFSSPTNHEGPSNYIPFVGHSVAQTPFDDNFFDVISAKTLWYLIQEHHWDVVLREFYRILKPGGVIELTMCDFNILNKSPLDRFLWDQFQKSVANKRMNPRITIHAAGLLVKAGFKDVHRAAIALPRGWGGQIGQLTDFLSSFYTDSLLRFFGDFMPEEIEAFKRRSMYSIDLGYYEAGMVFLNYGVKPGRTGSDGTVVSDNFSTPRGSSSASDSHKASQVTERDFDMSDEHRRHTSSLATEVAFPHHESDGDVAPDHVPGESVSESTQTDALESQDEAVQTDI